MAGLEPATRPGRPGCSARYRHGADGWVKAGHDALGLVRRVFPVSACFKSARVSGQGENALGGGHVAGDSSCDHAPAATRAEAPRVPG